ncbi:hypothetical protein EC991_002786 [Linnemannia zychae]|nr:hypothetical protein EC991_002786 [Linnemannia zychae]
MSATSPAYFVDIDHNKAVDHLKKCLTIEKTNDFSDIDANELAHWRVSTPNDDGDDDKQPILLNSVGKKKMHKVSDPRQLYSIRNGTTHILCARAGSNSITAVARTRDRNMYEN